MSRDFVRLSNGAGSFDESGAKTQPPLRGKFPFETLTTARKMVAGDDVTLAQLSAAMTDKRFGALSKMAPLDRSYGAHVVGQVLFGPALQVATPINSSMAAALARLSRSLQRQMPASRAEATGRRIMDWLTLHALLPALCDADILEETFRHNAPLFEPFADKRAKGAIPREFEAVAWFLQAGDTRDPFPTDAMVSMPGPRKMLDTLDFQGIPLRRLSDVDLLKGEAGAIARREDLLKEPPLVFYLGQEISTLGEGQRFGPLGSLILAEVIGGQVIHDRSSFWHMPGSDGGRWHPRDDVFPTGEPIDSLAALLRAARPT
ncbi:MAG: hypothetical protein AAFY65_17745 [Pseudomonadota bacterium]